MQLYRQNFTLDEYEFLTSSSSFQKLTQSSVSIKYPDGSLISADKVFKNLTKTHVTEFVMWFHDESPVFLPATVKTLCQYLAQCGNLGIFYLYRLPETFDVRQISDFLKLPSNIDIVLHFEASISDECKEILSKFIKEIIENPPQNIPLIQYNEQDLDDLITLMALKRERRRS
uniref:Uncharacterized protein n=1 Tax=Panagrolaimus superbus TaxID=310955 RepID=A0A914YTQ5_9BILA